MCPIPDGVLPDDVSRDPRSESWLVFIDFAPGANIQTWLESTATPAVKALTQATPGVAASAVCTPAVGASLFQKFSPPSPAPLQLSTALPSRIPADNRDMLLYIFSLTDAPVASLLRAINTAGVVAAITIERGYQRSNKREVFGQLDGLRNPSASQRAQVAFIGEAQPDEPASAQGGSYLTYIKIQQNVAQWLTLNPTEQAAIIGRGLDGTRLDLPDGTPVSTEGPFTQANVPPVCAHIRKAGPRGPNEDPVRIFRRGTPYIECDAGSLTEGLQFVAYQSSMDDLLAILDRWMLNPNFTAAGSGIDSLFDPANSLTQFIKGGVYFALPHDDRFIGAGLFDPPNVNNLIIRLTVLDATNAPDPTASLEGATFQITNAAGAVLTTVTTDAAGHAYAPDVATGIALTVTEQDPPPGATITPGPTSQTVTLDRCPAAVVTFTNTRSGTPGGYGA